MFPPSHVELLPVRDAKKERAAFDELVGNSKDVAVENTHDRSSVDTR